MLQFEKDFLLTRPYQQTQFGHRATKLTMPQHAAQLEGVHSDSSPVIASTAPY
jgi:hypothetical protein